jgi:hypothetical protein
MMEAAVGTIPVLGNIADAVWKANARNMALVEKHYRPGMQERSLFKLAAFVIGTLIMVYGAIAFMLFLLFSWVIRMFGALFQF